MIGAVRQPQIWKKFRIFCVLGVLSACSSFRLAPQEQAKTLDASFLAMGARWQMSVQNKPKSLEFSDLKTKVMALALLYENTFSDWSEESELRQLEKKGLHTKQIPSTLFWSGLELSQKAFKESKGAFDITVGDQLWKVRKKALGQKHLRMDDFDKSFYFTAPVKRLTFGGIAKGMALGDMAELLLRSGVSSFRIDAGGGNVVETMRDDRDRLKVVFISRSKFTKAGSSSERHIINPDTRLGASLTAEGVELRCETGDLSLAVLREMGALSDAMSTALVVNKVLVLPKNCVRQ